MQAALAVLYDASPWLAATVIGRGLATAVGSQVMGLWPKGQVPVRLSTTTAGLRAVVRVLE